MSVPQTEVPNDQVPATAATPKPVSVSPKSGFQSSEFASVVATAVAIGSGHVPANYQPLLIAIVGVYTACRTLLKAVHALGYAKQVPDLPDVNLKGLPK